MFARIAPTIVISAVLVAGAARGQTPAAETAALEPADYIAIQQLSARYAFLIDASVNGGYEDTYVETPSGWRFASRVHVFPNIEASVQFGTGGQRAAE